MSRLTEGWLDEFGYRYVENPRSSGSTYDPEGEGYPWRICLHTTESDGMPNTATHPYSPQLWADYATGQLIQTIPLTRAGFALYQGAFAPYYTNRARAIQVELVGRAKGSDAWPDERLRWIAEKVIVPICKFVESQGGRILFDDAFVPLPGVEANSAREDAPQRLAPIVWAFGTGLCAHRHVPMGDDHWDALMSLRKIAAMAVEIMGGSGHFQPIPTDARKRAHPMHGRLRTDKQGNTIVGRGYGHPGDVIFYDFTCVPAGAIVAAHALRPGGEFNMVPLVGGTQLGPIEAKWGSPAFLPIKSTSFVTLVLPADWTPDQVDTVMV